LLHDLYEDNHYLLLLHINDELDVYHNQVKLLYVIDHLINLFQKHLDHQYMLIHNELLYLNQDHVLLFDQLMFQ